MRIGRILLMGLGAYSTLNINAQNQEIEPKNMFEIDVLKQHAEVENIRNLISLNKSMCVVMPEEVNMYFLQKTMNTEINNKEEMSKNIVRLISKKVSIRNEDIKSIFIKRTSDMLENEIKNQVLQVLNYSDNEIAGDRQLISLLANCNGIIKKYNPDKNKQSKFDFNQSLDNTVKVLEEREGYEEYLNNLEINNQKSFIVAPVTSRSHLFSMVIRKKENKEGNVYLDVVVVNKGGRREEIGENNFIHNIYEKYMIPQKNIKDFSKMIGYHKNVDKNGKKITTGKVYEKIRSYTENSSYQPMKELTARQQVVGNCYYKELEAGLKYAYASSYNVFETKIINGVEQKTPKWPVETVEFHKDILNSLKDIVDFFPLKLQNKVELKDFINKYCLIYEKNKNYRVEMRNRNLDYDEERNVFVKYFGKEGINGVYETKDEKKLKEMFQDVDFITFNEQYSLFMKMLGDAGVLVPNFLINIHGDSGVVKEIVEYMYNNEKEDGDFIKEYFKLTYDVVKMKYETMLDNKPKKDDIKPKQEYNNDLKF